MWAAPGKERVFCLLLLAQLQLLRPCRGEGVDCAPFDGIDIGSLASDFSWGVATSAYQIEGATDADGRGECIWDVFDKVTDGTDGKEACESYYKFPEDIELMTDMGVDNYRMSISWARIFPEGRGQVNELGIAHYKELIEALSAKGIAPVVTIYHWDMPLALEQSYSSWLDKQIIEDFTAFADVCFEAFGDMVKTWVTFNEPNTYCRQGYNAGNDAPGRCSSAEACPDGGDSWTEPYIACHNSILAHAAAANLYKEKYQEKQGGKIGIISVTEWGEPFSVDSEEDVEAAQRWKEFQAGWILGPVFHGDYPASMRERVGTRLPHFSPQEQEQLRGSADFLGFNFYGASFCRPSDDWATTGGGRITNESDPWKAGWYTDVGVKTTQVNSAGLSIGPKADSSWLTVVPWSMRRVLQWLHQEYPGVDIFVTENGVDVPDESSLELSDALHDSFRMDYMRGYLAALSEAAAEGVPVKGYFVWSLMDNFEFSGGFKQRFGLYYTDFTDEALPRYPKASSKWYRDLVAAFRRCHTSHHTSTAAATPIEGEEEEEEEKEEKEEEEEEEEAVAAVVAQAAGATAVLAGEEGEGEYGKAATPSGGGVGGAGQGWVSKAVMVGVLGGAFLLGVGSGIWAALEKERDRSSNGRNAYQPIA